MGKGASLTPALSFMACATQGPGPEPATIVSLTTMLAAATVCGSWKRIIKRFQLLKSP